MAETQPIHSSLHRQISLPEIGEEVAHAMGTTLPDIRNLGRNREGIETRVRFTRILDDKHVAPGEPSRRIGELIGRGPNAISKYRHRDIRSFTQDQIDLALEKLSQAH